MQVNAINSFSNVNFQKKYRAPQNVQHEQNTETPKNSSLRKIPVYAAFMVAPFLPSCHYKVGAHAEATAYITPDTIVQPGTNDTIIRHDTTYIPRQIVFPQEIEDSLNFWRGDILDIDTEDEIPGEPKEYGNKILLGASGYRDWDYHKYEKITFDPMRSDSLEARYNHTIYDPITRTDSIKGDIRITKVNPGDITVIRPRNDGTEEITDQVSGLLWNVDGLKAFMHSNGRDKIFLYERVNDGVDRGRYRFVGTVEPGYLDRDEVGQNVLLNGLLGRGTEDHYTGVKAKVVTIDDLRDIVENDFENIMGDL